MSDQRIILSPKTASSVELKRSSIILYHLYLNYKDRGIHQPVCKAHLHLLNIHPELCGMCANSDLHLYSLKGDYRP